MIKPPPTFLGIPVRALRAAFLGVLITATLIPLMGLPYQADDNVNRSWPMLSIPDAIDAGVTASRTWMFEQGRFFPGGALYGGVMWNIFDSRVAYMTYLALMGMLLVGLVAYVVWRSTKSAQIAAFGALALGSTMQLRFAGAFDGLASFGGLVVYTLVLTLVSALLAAHVLHGGSHWFSPLIAVTWGLAITAYEVSLLMLPAILLMLVVTAPRVRRWSRWLWAFVPLVVPAALQIGVTFFLRRRELPLAPAYQVDLGGPVGTTFGKQFTAALPMAQEGWGIVPLNATLTILLIITIGLPLVLAWRPWFPTLVRVRDRVAVAMAAAGLWAWTVPSVLAAITVRWQAELPWGQGYIYLVYEYVGFAFFATGIGTLLFSRREHMWARLSFAALFVVFAAACCATAGVNIFGVGTIVPGAQGPG